MYWCADFTSFFFWRASFDPLYHHPRCSMYGLFTNVWVVWMVNVGNYAIHWAFGHNGYASLFVCFFSVHVAASVSIRKWPSFENIWYANTIHATVIHCVFFVCLLLRQTTKKRYVDTYAHWRFFELLHQRPILSSRLTAKSGNWTWPMIACIATWWHLVTLVRGSRNEVAGCPSPRQGGSPLL